MKSICKSTKEDLNFLREVETRDTTSVAQNFPYQPWFFCFGQIQTLIYAIGPMVLRHIGNTLGVLYLLPYWALTKRKRKMIIPRNILTIMIIRESYRTE